MALVFARAHEHHAPDLPIGDELAALEADLAKTRKRGYATDIAEGLEGIHCVAAAVLDEYRYPVAAVTVMAPSFRLKRDQFEKLGHLCIQAAETITRRLLA